jgi:hypothetical protein
MILRHILAHRLDIVDVGKKMKECLYKSEGFEACRHQAGLELGNRVKVGISTVRKKIITRCNRTFAPTLKASTGSGKQGICREHEDNDFKRRYFQLD